WHPDRRRVLVNSRTAMNYAVVAPIHRALAPDPRIEFYFTASESPQRMAETYRDAGQGLSLVTAARAGLMKFDAYLAADFLWVTLPRGVSRIQTFHGVAGKHSREYEAPTSSMRLWDRLFFINRRRLQNYVAVGAIDADAPAACLIGMPKVDCLVDGSLHRDVVLRSLGIDPARRTILYAPTWSCFSSLNTMGEELIEQLLRAGHLVIVKLHDRSRDPQYVNSGGIDWEARLNPILRRFGGLLVQATDVCPYMVASDVLITDHSSVGFEYLLLDRPVVRIDSPTLISATDVHPAYVELLDGASTSVRTSREAVAAVERSLAEPSYRSATRKATAEELFYRPGTATARAVTEIYKVLELDPPSAFLIPEMQH
ncbi:MAG: CDP-glycerol glycerophosphotransferase family protein, partial [Acidimicrobiia bacterium]